MIEINDNCLEVLNKFAPLRPYFLLNQNDSPWFNSDIGQPILIRHTAWRRWRSARPVNARQTFCTRNTVTRLVRDAKRWYFINRLNTGMGSEKNWGNLKAMGQLTSKQVMPRFNAADYSQILSSIDEAL